MLKSFQDGTTLIQVSVTFQACVTVQESYLPNDLPFSVEVIPDDESVEITARGEKYAALGLFAQAVGESDVFFGL